MVNSIFFNKNDLDLLKILEKKTLNEQNMQIKQDL
jgi:hypothetical protein